jgi:hypothetical protein
MLSLPMKQSRLKRTRESHPLLNEELNACLSVKLKVPKWWKKYYFLQWQRRRRRKRKKK